MLAMYGNFMPLNETEQAEFSAHFARERKSLPNFANEYLTFLADLYQSNPNMGAEQDERMAQMVDLKVEDKISDVYRIVNKVHSLGYVHPDVIDDVQEFYNTHKGLSIESKCLRQVVLNYFGRLMGGLTEREYADYFELNKIFTVYMHIFSNQEFNQAVEKVSMRYIQKLLKVYVDKRGRDYQDIKKFVSTQFVDMGFLDDKEIVEMFKTRRKKRKSDEG
jgi:hypothetical protein